MNVPHDHELEAAVLASAMLSREAYDGLAEIARQDWFHRPMHRKVFDALLELHGEGIEPDVRTIAAKLASWHGDGEYIAEVAGLDVMLPDVNRWESYFGQAAELARRRLLQDVGRQMAIGAADPEMSAVDVAQQAQAKLAGIEDNVIRGQWDTLDEAMEEAAEEAFQPPNEAKKGIETGYRDLDKYLHPLQPGQFVIVAGRPGMGKSVFALQVSLHAARQGKRVAFLSLEMTKREICQRIYACEGEVDHDRLQRNWLNPSDRERVVKVHREFRGKHLSVDDCGRMSALEAAMRLRKFRRLHGGLDLAVIDHLQLLSASRTRNSGNLEMSETSNIVRGLAKELECPILALSQLSRAFRDRSNKRPTLSDLRESGSLEQDAHVVIGVYRPEIDDEDPSLKGLAELIVLKQRGGRLVTAEMAFDGAHVRFRDLYKEAR